MNLEPNHLHIWSTELTPASVAEDLHLLSEDERERANRYHFPIHRQRYIAARAMLRKILSFYIHLTPERITFSYSANEKPSLQLDSDLNFNLSHSGDIAVYALTLNHSIGIDIEKTQTSFNQNLAERFFSPQEYEMLKSRPEQEQANSFYRIWARKEAIIKANGKGLTIPLASFSVSDQNICENVTLDQCENWTLIPLIIHDDYQSAVATNQTIQKISFWKLLNQTPTQDKEYNL